MKYIGLIFCLLIGLGLATQSASGQTKSYVAPGATLASPAINADVESTDPASVITIQKRVDEVNVLFIAMNKHGKFVRDLQARDFNVLDDNKPPQQIVNFSSKLTSLLNWDCSSIPVDPSTADSSSSRKPRSVFCNTPSVPIMTTHLLRDLIRMRAWPRIPPTT